MQMTLSLLHVWWHSHLADSSVPHKFYYPNEAVMNTKIPRTSDTPLCCIQEKYRLPGHYVLAVEKGEGDKQALTQKQKTQDIRINVGSKTVTVRVQHEQAYDFGCHAS